jgi:formylglycine-generating enzyme required for sulfatase activity
MRQGTRRPHWIMFSIVASLSACYSSIGSDVDDDNATVDGDSGDAEPDDSDDGRTRPPGMILIPAGQFLMGSDISDCGTDRPLHQVWLPNFYIDRFEVSNGDYLACVSAGTCVAPGPASATRTNYFGVTEYATYPVLSVDWDSAARYCGWADKRLPTEAEWEKAARGGCELGADPDACDVGPDTRRFPWGDADPSCELANVLNSCLGDTSPTDGFPGDVSPYGVREMEGNVEEWTADYWDPAYYLRSPLESPPGASAEEATGLCPYTVDGVGHTARGFAFIGAPASLPCKDLTRRSCGDISQYTGFRCAVDGE